MDLFQRGRDYINATFKRTAYLILRITLAVIPIFGVIPILLSIYFQLLIIGPLRVSISQTPIFFPIKEWGMGILHLKIICATIMMGKFFQFSKSVQSFFDDTNLCLLRPYH